MFEQMNEQLSSQMLEPRWTSVTKNVIAAVFNKKQVLQTGLGCGLLDYTLFPQDLGSNNFICSQNVSQILVCKGIKLLNCCI